MRSPERKIFVMLKQSLRQLILFIKLFVMCHHFYQGALPLAVIRAALFRVTRRVAGGSIKAAAAQQRKEAFGKGRRVHARRQPPVSKLVRSGLAPNFLVLPTRRKFR